MKQAEYRRILKNVVSLLESARRASARAINSVITATYWEIGRNIVEYEQRGGKRSEHYGDEVVERLTVDLTARFGRGFGRANLFLVEGVGGAVCVVSVHWNADYAEWSVGTWRLGSVWNAGFRFFSRN